VTLTFDPLTSKLIHRVLGALGPFLPSLVFVGLFVFPLGGGTGQTDGQDRYMMGPPSRKDGPIINIINKSIPEMKVRLEVIECKIAKWTSTVSL